MSFHQRSLHRPLSRGGKKKKLVVRCSSRHLAAILPRDAELTIELTLGQALAVEVARA